MSSELEYVYTLGADILMSIEKKRRRERQQAEYEARRRANEERIRNNTEQFYERYLQQYEDMRTQNFENYIPDKMKRLSSDLQQIRLLLYSDVGAARDVSLHVGEYIHSMFREGNAAEREQRMRAIEKEHRRQEKARAEHLRQKGEIDDIYYTLISEIKDQAVINFSAKELSDLHKSVNDQSSMAADDFRKQAETIISRARVKAEEWEKKSNEKEPQHIVSEKLQIMKEQLEQKKVEDQEKAQTLLSHITALQESIRSDSQSQAELEKEIEKTEADVDSTLISEDIRREAVKSVFLSLKKQGFQVQPPQLIQDDEHNYVRITAKKPSGKRVQCKLDINGKLAYRFDEYEGMTCLNDIEKFNIELDRVYSVKLSDERVIWKNPDKISKDSNSTNIPKRRNQ